MTDTVRLAATVLLIRDGDRGVEVFMEKRHIKSDFVGGAYVFPGGRVDPEDQVDPALCAGIVEDDANERLGLSSGALIHYVAAIRECFEEAGVLLAYDRDGNLLDFADEAVEERYKDHRDALNAGKRSLVEIAELEGLRFATDHIHYWSHWVTPEGQPRRYDTRFFVALAPERQTAAHDDWELTSSAWVTPKEAIAKAKAKEWMIIFPTLRNLEQLGQYATASEAVEATRAKTEFPVMLPRVVVEEGVAVRVALPGDAGYESAVRDISNVDPRVFGRT